MRTSLLLPFVALTLAGVGCSSSSDDSSGSTGGTSPQGGSGGSVSTGGSAGTGVGGAAGKGGSSATGGTGGAHATGGAAGTPGAGGSAGSTSTGGAAGSTAAGGNGGSTGGSGGSAGTGGSGGSGGTGPLAITPASGTVLTCTKTQLSANQTPVTWSASAGTIDATGLFTSPKQPGADVTITATSSATPPETATADLALATAVLGSRSLIAPVENDAAKIYQHGSASRGDRVYATAILAADATHTARVTVTRSDDGGKTWGAPVAATPDAGTARLACASIAVDAGNPDVVYLLFSFDQKSGIPVKYVSATTDDARGMALAVSTDGGATFPTVKVLQSGSYSDPSPNFDAVCGDVTSIKPDTVAVTKPGAGGAALGGSTATVGMYLWVDEQKGAGLSTDTTKSTMNDTVALEETGALIPIGKDASGAIKGTRLFSDGKGMLCAVYGGYGPTLTGTVLSCSSDLGKTFATPVIVDADTGQDVVGAAASTGAVGPNGEIAIAWPHGLAVSTDGKTFTNVSPSDLGQSSGQGADVRFDAAGVLWLAYAVTDNSNGTFRTVVDRTCDLAVTWSGAVTQPDTEAAKGSNDTVVGPALVIADSRVTLVVPSALDPNGFELRGYSLTP